MLKKVEILNNEKGSAIVIAIMLLLVLTIIGLSSSSTSTVELQIVRNEGIYKQNLYLAEAAAHEAIQRIWNLTRSNPTQLLVRSPVWLNDETVDMTSLANWDNDGADNDDTALVSSIDPATSLSVVDVGIAAGGSLDISGGTNVHDFAVYGLSNFNNGRVLIQIGYRERF